jgi:phage-related baseplate assembly protein
VNITNLFGLLPDFDFVEKNPETIKNAIIANYEAAHSQATGEKITLYPGDPRRLFLLSVANTIILQRNLIDWVGKENLLAFATENRLDHLGVLLGVTRLSSQRAHTTLRFTLSTERESVIVIPVGTRAAPSGGTIYFATAGTLEISPGDLSGDVRAEAMDYGLSANGFLPGQINHLVDPLPYIQSVANITASEGGADIEDDENLRERIHLAPESFSNAGSSGAYIFWARSASQLIVDVGVSSPAPGEVNIFPLLESGEIPGQEILDAVLGVCNADTVRPMTDLVHVLPPQTVEFDLNVTWYLERSNAVKVTDISSRVNSAVQNWLSWQRSRLGRDINPSELIARMVQAGAKRVIVESPVFSVLEFNEIAIATSESVIYGGIEDG